MELHINYQKCFEQNYQCIIFPNLYNSNLCYVEFGRDFQPGVWAGTEGLILKNLDYEIKIIKVDFENKRLECNKL